MDNRQQFFWLTALEGILCFVLLLIIPSDPKNAWMFGLSLFRLLIALGLVLAVLIVLWLGINLRWETHLGARSSGFHGRIYASPTPRSRSCFFVPGRYPGGFLFPGRLGQSLPALLGLFPAYIAADIIHCTGLPAGFQCLEGLPC